MDIEIHGLPFTGDLFETRNATKVVFRDPEGHLVMFVAIMKDRRTMLVCRAGQEDFEWNARNHGIPLVKTGTQSVSLRTGPAIHIP